VFPSVLYHGRHLVDGAVSASTPISAAVRLGATRVIVLPCGFACATNTIPKHPWGRAMHAIARGRESTRQWLDKDGLACRDFPAQLTIHSHR
jgi:predicted acylesterase/phospholipase RssA